MEKQHYRPDQVIDHDKLRFHCIWDNGTEERICTLDELKEMEEEDYSLMATMNVFLIS